MIGCPRVFIGLAAAGVLLTAPAAAQDWQPLEAGPGVSAVAVQWDSGTKLALQCRREGLMAQVQLLHPVSGTSVWGRYETRAFAGAHGWRLASGGSVAIADMPERFARSLLAGGALVLVFSPADSARQRYELSLPDDATVLRALLSDCDVAEEDPRDTAPRAMVEDPASGLSWIARPSVQQIFDAVPNRAIERHRGGQVTLSCRIERDGRLADCDAVSEWPRGAGFGPAFGRVFMRHARLGDAGGQAATFDSDAPRVEIPIAFGIQRMR
jgi:hypothetical protein